MLSDNQKVAIVVIGLGALFLMLGVLLLFDSGLLAIGNVLVLVGMTMLNGVTNCLKFFNPMRRPRGVVCFFLGVLLVLFALRVWALQGWYIVTYGLGIFLLNLFIGFITPQVRGRGGVAARRLRGF